ncbi:MAG: iron-sulfur cluster assembly scaffold protein [Candidatus Coatesbacteria bacterium]|nr:iron-sulfur cluster assembly scaffold protein [Candidatus Coatesbacteria bacterium]
MNKSDDKENLPCYPQEVQELLNDTKLFGRMNDPTSSAYLKGPCGDEMEFYLVIKENRITEIKYYTQGCDYTKSCAAMTASLAEGKTVQNALLISAGDVIDRLKGLPDDHLHCSILAVSTLYRAIADYFLQA